MRQNLTLADLPPMSQEEKEWWEEHNAEYYHYFYKIDNKLNGKFYYGIHSQRIDSGKLPENDGYMGSGTDLKKAQNEDGIENFSKTIIKTFSTRDEARLEEMMVVDEDLINDPMCYNMVVGGGCVPTYLLPTKGFAIVNFKDPIIRKERMFLVPSEEYEENRDKYITASSGKVSVDFAEEDKKTGKFFLISVEEYEKNKNLYVVSTSGKSIYRSADGNNVRLLDTKSPLVSSGEYIPIAKGRKQSQEVVAKKTGKGNGMYGKMWITNGTESKIIGKSEPLPPGFYPGRFGNHSEKTKGPGVLVTNKFTKETKRVLKRDLSSLDDDVWFTSGYFKGGEFISYEKIQDIFERTNSWTKVQNELNISRESLNKVKKYYETKGKSFKSSAIIRKPRERGKWSSGMKNRVYIHNAEGYKTIKRDDLDEYLSKGWKLGRKINR